MSNRYYIEPHEDKYKGSGYVLRSTHTLNGSPRGCFEFFKDKQSAEAKRDRLNAKEDEKVKIARRRKRR